MCIFSRLIFGTGLTRCRGMAAKQHHSRRGVDAHQRSWQGAEGDREHGALYRHQVHQGSRRPGQHHRGERARRFHLWCCCRFCEACETVTHIEQIITDPHLIWCLWYTKFCWVGKHIDIIMKPTNSPTQGQPNPRKFRFKSGIWATFSQSNFFFVGWDCFYIGNRLQET